MCPFHVVSGQRDRARAAVSIYSPMHSVSELGMQARISTSLSEHLVQTWHGLVLLSSSEKCPGPHTRQTVSPFGLHSWTSPWPGPQLEQGAHKPWTPQKKKPLSHSHCVSSVAVQEANLGTLSGHVAQGLQGPSPSDEEKVPGKQIVNFSSCANNGRNSQIVFLLIFQHLG